MEWSSTALPRWPGKEERRLVHASVVVEGQLVHVFNTHLDHTSVALRLAQIRAVNRVIARFADAPMILGGDLNAIPEGPGADSPSERHQRRVARRGRRVRATPCRLTIPGGGSITCCTTLGSPRTQHRSSRRDNPDHAALRIAFDLRTTQGCAG